MADVPVVGNYLVSPDLEVELKWSDAAINEKMRQVEGLEVAIKELKTVRILQMEAKVMMLNKEIKFLKDKRTQLGPINV